MGLTTEKYNQLMEQAVVMPIGEIQRNYSASFLELERLRKRYEEESEIMLQVWVPVMESKRFK